MSLWPLILPLFAACGFVAAGWGIWWLLRQGDAEIDAHPEWEQPKHVRVCSMYEQGSA